MLWGRFSHDPNHTVHLGRDLHVVYRIAGLNVVDLGVILDVRLVRGGCKVHSDVQGALLGFCP